MFEHYPWHNSIWQQLLSRFTSGKLPHALLFTGVNGVGKRDFAQQFSQLLLCQTFQQGGISSAESSQPCGQCQACALNKAATHPDLYIVEPETEGKIIAVDQVRALSTFMSLKSQYGNLQIVIISPAEKMNRFAANSLLKTLEEPTPSSLILLVSSQPSALLPTIRSRCQNVFFPRPSEEMALQWLLSQAPKSNESQLNEILQLTNGAPLEALQYLTNKNHELAGAILQSFAKVAQGGAEPLAVAKIWAEADLVLVIKWLILWTSHIIRLKSHTQMPDNYPVVGENTLKKIASTIDLRGLFRWLDKLTEVRRLLDSQANAQLLMEDLLIFWFHLNQNTNSQLSVY